LRHVAWFAALGLIRARAPLRVQRHVNAAYVNPGAKVRKKLDANPRQAAEILPMSPTAPG
jgi:hypothetical protein